MPFYTPLRYPGGKRRLVSSIVRLLAANRLTNIEYAEPYAGGAAIALALLFGEQASVIHINDLSRPVHAFWYSVLHHTDDLCRRVERTSVTMREWHKQRAVYDRRETADVPDLGFATLFLNRTNRSGIVAGGVIGGKKQGGTWTLDARFNRDELVQRIRRIRRYGNRINLHQSDALQFTTDVVSNLGLRSFAFYDPPYIENGDGLYLNTYDVDGHRRLAARVMELTQPWVVTYDSAAITHGLYGTKRRIVYGLNYVAQARYEGREVMFLADRLALPDGWQKPRAQIELSPPRSKNPVFGRMENMKSQTEKGQGPRAAERFERTPRPVRMVSAAGSVPVKSVNGARRKRNAATRPGR